MNAPSSALATHEMSRPAQSVFPPSAKIEHYDESFASRLASISIDKIEGLITELQEMQRVLRSEAERVNREVRNYLQTAQTALTATKTITDSFAAPRESPNPAGGVQSFPAGPPSGGREKLKRWPAPAG